MSNKYSQAMYDTLFIFYDENNPPFAPEENFEIHESTCIASITHSCGEKATVYT